VKQLLKDFLTGLSFIIAVTIIVSFTGLVAVLFPDIFGIIVVIMIITGIGKIVNYLFR
jgi:hypothetical protein